MSEENSPVEDPSQLSAPSAAPEPNAEPAVEAVAAEPVAPPPRRPGAVLREAREAAGLTVFEVAQFLKFSPRQIEALETDDYDALPPGATFLRGFVRGYAKLLKLDVLPLLGMLDNSVPATVPDVRAPQNMGIAETPVTANRRSSKPALAAAGLLAVLALALGAWHFLGTPKAPASPPVAAADNKAEPAVRPPDLNVVDAAPVAGEPGAAAARPADTRQLVFAFQDKSWVEVTDASGQIILSGENGAGARQAVSGKPPFQVVIGNAPKVELHYEERQIDLKPYTRADVARLTLE